ncbi:MAG: cytochrome c [Bacteriovoracaceae bacterium]|nr:cytochrome c [Bacteriovoracaceae bacterium]
MKNSLLVTIIIYAILLIFTSGCNNSEMLPVKKGAQLYDNWPALKGKKFSQSHQSYPKEGNKKGTSTFKCQECHGWDYLGNKGMYAKGPHYTGIKGIYEMKSKSKKDLLDILKNSKTGHDFSKWLSSEDLENLIKFIQVGMMDVSLALDDNGQAKGSKLKGQLLIGKCLGCHGSSGKRYDLDRSKPGKQGLKDIAKANPQETLHKISWGHPQTGMPSGIADLGLSTANVIDILTHLMK